jgi:hypothetical protein
MAIINKTSLPDELNRLQSYFDRLPNDQKMSGETKMLMRSMLTLLELIFAIFLEKKTSKDSLLIIAVLSKQSPSLRSL